MNPNPTTRKPRILSEKRVSNKRLVRIISTLSGFSREEAKLAFRSVMRAIHDELIAGRTVTLHGLGTFVFKLRRGRVVPAGGFARKERVQPETVSIKFLASEDLKRRVRLSKPEKVILPGPCYFKRADHEAIIMDGPKSTTTTQP